MNVKQWRQRGLKRASHGPPQANALIGISGHIASTSGCEKLCIRMTNKFRLYLKALESAHSAALIAAAIGVPFLPRPKPRQTRLIFSLKFYNACEQIKSEMKTFFLFSVFFN
jgi:hypothetical protein